MCANDDAYDIVRINLRIGPEFNGPDRGVYSFDQDSDTDDDQGSDEDEDGDPYEELLDTMDTFGRG